MKPANANNFYRINSKEPFIGFKIDLIESYAEHYPNALTFAEFDIYDDLFKCSVVPRRKTGAVLYISAILLLVS